MKPDCLSIREKELQSMVTRLAGMIGWRKYHTLYSVGSDAGFPDLVLVRRGRLIFAELKSERGKLRPEQEDWLDELGAVEQSTDGVVRAKLWRPSHWLNGEIEEVLRFG